MSQFARRAVRRYGSGGFGAERVSLRQARDRHPPERGFGAGRAGRTMPNPLAFVGGGAC